MSEPTISDLIHEAISNTVLRAVQETHRPGADDYDIADHVTGELRTLMQTEDAANRCKVLALKEAATAAVSEEVGIPWDNDYDRATVAAWLEEFAERYAS